MRVHESSPEIGADVLQAARQAAQRTGSPFVIGWWVEGANKRLMLLPEGHPVTDEPPFLPLLRVLPSGKVEPVHP